MGSENLLVSASRISSGEESSSNEFFNPRKSSPETSERSSVKRSSRGVSPFSSVLSDFFSARLENLNSSQRLDSNFR
ncbi:Uncharacterised protein [Chlamydia trachomatis]|nr:Uncharacterised protein [Chlamydia trachomatis]